ncbi:hypothetical protein NQZ68_027011 [Dissostichus eleginoides]|nr:hypothetical protein NQZ68_027011 [Dissostichus eleginoides]
MPLVLDAVWALWSIGAGIYDYFHTSAMEERIHTLENVLSIHQFLIAGLISGINHAIPMLTVWFMWLFSLEDRAQMRSGALMGN